MGDAGATLGRFVVTDLYYLTDSRRCTVRPRPDAPTVRRTSCFSLAARRQLHRASPSWARRPTR